MYRRGRAGAGDKGEARYTVISALDFEIGSPTFNTYVIVKDVMHFQSSRVEVSLCSFCSQLIL